MESLLPLSGKPKSLTGLTHLEVARMEGNIKLSVNSSSS
jgi:hypothetical protein